MKMKERVARAIATSAGARMVGPGQSVATREFGWKGDGEHLDLYVETHWKEHQHAAQFAIEAMREPTAEMEMAINWVGGNTDNLLHPNKHIWRAMIDAALK